MRSATAQNAMAKMAEVTTRRWRAGSRTSALRRSFSAPQRAPGAAWIAPLLIGVFLEGLEPDALLDAGLLELEILLRQPLDALGLVEMRPLDFQNVGRLLAFDDLLVGAVDLLLEVLDAVLDREQADR